MSHFYLEPIDHIAERIAIVLKILADFKKQADVALEFRDKHLVVQALANKVHNNQRYPRKLRVNKDREIYLSKSSWSKTRVLTLIVD